MYSVLASSVFESAVEPLPPLALDQELLTSTAAEAPTAAAAAAVGGGRSLADAGAVTLEVLSPASPLHRTTPAFPPLPSPTENGHSALHFFASISNNPWQEAQVIAERETAAVLLCASRFPVLSQGAMELTSQMLGFVAKDMAGAF